MGFHSSEKEDLQKFVPQHKMGIKVLDESQLLNIFPTYQNLLDKIETYRHAINSLNTETLREERYQYNLMYDNVFSILGKRGTGKTSAVFSIKHLIEKDERYPNDRVFPIIMPEVIPENGNILGWIVALLSDTVDEIERRIKKSGQVSDDGDFFKNCLFVENNSLRKSLKEIRELCFSQKYNPKQESSFYEAIGNAAQQAQNSYSFAKAITSFWTALINAILKMNGQRSCSSSDQQPLIYFIFDDVDLSPDKVEHLMSIIAKYLAHPNVIVIVTADEDLFLEVIENSIDRKIGREKKDIRQILERYMEMTLYYGTFMDSPIQYGKTHQISEAARLYIGKVLPPSSRYYLELYYDSDRKRNFQIYHDINLEMGLSGIINKFLGVDEKSRNNFLYYNENFIDFYMEFFGNTARQISNEFFIIDDLINNLIKLRTEFLNNNRRLSFQYQYQVYNYIRHFVYSSINANHSISDMVADMNHLVDNLLIREYNNWFIYINYSYLNSRFIDMCQNIEDEEEIKIYLKQVIALYSLMFFTENILVLLDRVPMEGNMIPRTKVHGTNELSEYINQNVFSGEAYMRSFEDISEHLYHYEHLLHNIVGFHKKDMRSYEYINKYLHCFSDREGRSVTVRDIESWFMKEEKWLLKIVGILFLFYSNVFFINRKILHIFELPNDAKCEFDRYIKNQLDWFLQENLKSIDLEAVENYSIGEELSLLHLPDSQVKKMEQPEAIEKLYNLVRVFMGGLGVEYFSLTQLVVYLQPIIRNEYSADIVFRASSVFDYNYGETALSDLDKLEHIISDVKSDIIELKESLTDAIIIKQRQFVNGMVKLSKLNNGIYKSQIERYINLCRKESEGIVINGIEIFSLMEKMKRNIQYYKGNSKSTQEVYDEYSLAFEEVSASLDYAVSMPQKMDDIKNILLLIMNLELIKLLQPIYYNTQMAVFSKNDSFNLNQEKHTLEEKQNNFYYKMYERIKTFINKSNKLDMKNNKESARKYAYMKLNIMYAIEDAREEYLNELLRG